MSMKFGGGLGRDVENKLSVFSGKPGADSGFLLKDLLTLQGGHFVT